MTISNNEYLAWPSFAGEQGISNDKGKVEIMVCRDTVGTAHPIDLALSTGRMPVPQDARATGLNLISHLHRHS
jgi:hypothetical protein